MSEIDHLQVPNQVKRLPERLDFLDVTCKSAVTAAHDDLVLGGQPLKAETVKWMRC